MIFILCIIAAYFVMYLWYTHLKVPTWTDLILASFLPLMPFLNFVLVAYAVYLGARKGVRWMSNTPAPKFKRPTKAAES